MRLLPTTVMLLGTLPVLSLSSRAAAADWSRLSLDDALARAFERNPLVVESKLEVRRLQGVAEGVPGVLVDNPVLSAEGGVRRDQGWVGNQPSVAARLEQPIDLFGQAGARKRAAADAVAAAGARLRLVRSEVGARVRWLYLMAQVAGARVRLAAERLATAGKTTESLQMRVRLGASSEIDLHMALAEKARAEAALQQAQAAVGRSLLDLREVLDLPAQAQLQPSDALVAPPGVMADVEDEQALFVHHAAVQAVERQQMAIDSDIARLERERLPRLAVGVGFERPSNQERFLGLAVSISPGLWRRNQIPLAEARVERERLEIVHATTLASLQRRWTALRNEQTQRLQELSAIGQALEEEEATGTLVRTGWQAGKFDFFRVLVAERSIADIKLARLELWAELGSNAIELRRLAGQEP